MSTDNSSCHKPNSVNAVNSFSTFSVLYYNARSLLPKLDNLAAVCITCNPDIVCIVESWLSDDIQDNEISLPNYSVVRLVVMEVVLLCILRIHLHIVLYF